MIVSAYREDEGLRAQLDALTRLTYGFDFEAWYQAGHWRDLYIPYSLLIDGRLVANVSANFMNCMVSAETKRYIQLGTVMTHPDHRGRGYSRMLMDHVVAQWRDRCDGMYLYPNATVQQFYPRFGFVSATEYRYRVPEPLEGCWDAISVLPDERGLPQRNALYSAAGAPVGGQPRTDHVLCRCRQCVLSAADRCLCHCGA